MQNLLIVILAILLSSFGDYQSDAAQATANANASTINKACQVGLTNAAVAGVDFSYYDEYTVTTAIVNVDDEMITYFGSDYQIDLIDYLGTNFGGTGYSIFEADKYAATYCVWFEEEDLGTSVYSIDDLVELIEEQLDEGNLVGVYPKQENMSDFVDVLEDLS